MTDYLIRDGKQGKNCEIKNGQKNIRNYVSDKKSESFPIFPQIREISHPHTKRMITASQFFNL